MSRLLAAAFAALLLAGTARAQDDKKGAAPAAPPATTAPSASPPAIVGAPSAAPELDPKTKAAIQHEVERAKEDIRNEVRAEIQGAQSAAEFLGTVTEGPKLQFLQLNGYLRFRGSLYDNLDLAAPPDQSGSLLFPGRGTLASANMRFRLEPTLNVSEQVRVKSQLDILDNYVLGSSTPTFFDAAGSPYPVPWYGSSRVLYQNDPHFDRAPILPKRAWAEVQTPVGLLSFGRMPSEWGLGILTHAGEGIDDDYGDTVDRIQFAIPPLQTPIGSLTVVPMLDFDAEGALRVDPRFGPGVGQPFDAFQNDDARTYAIKIARIDTDDEIRRKFDKNQSSFNYGLYYNYRSQHGIYPDWVQSGLNANIPADGSANFARTSAYGHVFDLWVRWQSPRWRVEAEGVGVYGNVGNAYTIALDPTTNAAVATSLGSVMLRQWGGTVVTEYKALPGKLMFGGEFGIASGDDAPGFGNVPGRLAVDPTTGATSLPGYGSFEGPQFGRAGDHSIRNFRFNPGYRVDLVLWREILGQVTDAWYVKPKLRWDILPGLALDFAVVYSQAMYAQSTPSSAQDDAGNLTSKGKKPLGIEGDGMLTYTSGDGFVVWGQAGVLQPFDALLPSTAEGSKLSRGYNLAAGLAAKF